MPECVPANPAKSCTNPSGNEVVALDRPRPPRPSRSIGAWEKPIGFLCVGCCFALVLQQELCQLRMNGQPPVRVGSFHLIDTADYNSPLNMDLKTLPIEVAPLQADQLACAEPETHRNDAHCADGLLQVLQKKEELPHGQSSRLLQTFRRTFHPHQIHRIHLVHVDQFPLHRPVEQDVHDAADVPFALRRKIKFRKPFLNEQRLDFLNRNVRPLWFNMVNQPGTVLARSRVPLWQFLPYVTINKRAEQDFLGWLWSIDRLTKRFRGP